MSICDNPGDSEGVVIDMVKRKKDNLRWIQETLELKGDHQWRSKPGYKIFVADRGAVRFDVPQDWVCEPDTHSFKFLDREPPEDDCRLEMSFNHLPPGDWRRFPLQSMLKKIVQNDERNIIATTEIMTLNRQTARIVWTEVKFVDAQNNRAAFSRVCIGLGSNIQCLITFDYWVEDAERQIPVWNEVLRSLSLGLYSRDPAAGSAAPD